MSRLSTTCSGCGEQLEVTRLTCPACETRIEGRFELPELLRLERDDLAFVLDFVRCSGSLKDLCQLRGQSYPTIRNRLDEIIARLSPGDEKVETKRRKVLDALAKGELSVREATKRLKELGS
jgi:hypothetical protein